MRTMSICLTILVLSIPAIGEGWSGQVSLGWNSTSGNTDADNKSLSLSAERRTEKYRLTGGADLGKGKHGSIVTEDWFRSVAKYDYFLSPKWYGFVNSRYETDKVALLDNRTMIGGGAGYQLIDRDKTHFRLEVGLASQREEYATGASKSELTAQVGYMFDHQLVKTVKFVHDLSYFPSTDEVSDYYLTSTAGVRANFTESMFGTFKTIYSRDASPAPGRGNSDVKFILGVGIGF